ncbi:MAG: DNA (cytosine-5-)-methyltransferase [Oscillospiraceae bacterium]
MKREWNNNSHTYQRKFSEPEWKQVSDLKFGDFIGINILSSSENIYSLSDIDCWLLGRYVADGYIRNSKRPNRENSYNHQVVFCIGKNKLQEFKKITNNCNYHIGISEGKTVFKCGIISNAFMELCLECGKGAENKTIPNWIVNLPVDLLKCFLNGYMSGDGCITQTNYKATTVSKNLAQALVLCIAKVYRVGCKIYHTKRPCKTVIEGRIVNQKDTYQVVFSDDIRKQKQYEVIDNIIWCPIRNITKLGYKANVYNIEVENMHTYTANNAIVHNCQDFSVAGKQEGAKWTCEDCHNEYNPLEAHYSKRDECPKCHSKNIVKTRSSLIVELLRIIREKKPKVFLYENVKNLIGKQFKATFDLFIAELGEYGYNCHYKVLNAKNYGIPQNRERVYIVIIKKELDNGKFEFPEPFDNGIRLKHVLDAEVDEKFYISQDKVNRLITNLNSKNAVLYDSSQVLREGKAREYNEYSPTLTSRDYKDPRLVNVNVVGRISSSQDGVVVSPDGLSPTHTAGHGNCPKILENKVTQVGNIVDTGNWDNPQRGRIYSPDGCCPALNCCGGGGLEPKIIQPQSAAIRGRYTEDGDIEQHLEFGSNDYTNTITTVQKDNVLVEDKNVLGVIDPQGRKNKDCKINANCPTLRSEIHGNLPQIICEQRCDEGLRFFKDNICGALRTIDSCGDKRIIEQSESTVGFRIRKLTPKECYRLMGFRDEDFYKAEKVVSNSQLYKQSGNSIVVDVLFYILVELYKAMPYLFDDVKLSSFFSGIGAFEIALDRIFKCINDGTIENFTKPQAE